jgi:hypothetical protein
MESTTPAMMMTPLSALASMLPRKPAMAAMARYKTRAVAVYKPYFTPLPSAVARSAAMRLVDETAGVLSAGAVAIGKIGFEGGK